MVVTVATKQRRETMDKQKWNGKRMGEWLKANAERKAVIETAILRIDERQTVDERISGETRYSNGIGWSGADASVGTYLANYIRSGNSLSGAWRLRGLRLAIKYRGQLADIANAKAA
jgi:hypothetical protein